MTQATIVDPNALELTYASPILPAAFAPGDHITNPGGSTSTGYVSTGSDTVEVEFDLSVIGEVSVTYDGANPGLVDPQTIAIT